MYKYFLKKIKLKYELIKTILIINTIKNLKNLNRKNKNFE